MIKNLLQKANFVFALTEQGICGFPILMTFLFCHIYIVHVHRFSCRERYIVLKRCIALKPHLLGYKSSIPAMDTHPL